MLRRAVCRAASLTASGWVSACGAGSSAAQLQAPTRSLAALISLRNFRQQPWAAQSAAAAAGEPGPAEAAVAAASPAAAAAAAAPLPPWTPTRELQKRKILTKRMQHLLTTLEVEREAELAAAQPRPDFGPGDMLELKLSVPENKRRVTTFKGICIARRNRSVRSTFTLRNLFGASGGIERTFPLYSPHILEVKVLERRQRPRRAKLYYLRERTAKEYRA